MRVSCEVLDSGMQAVYLHAPHFKTTSARLGFYSGSLHQSDDMPPGVAHFLEHTPFQGTVDFPSLESLNSYAQADGSDINAFTNRTSTTYEADGVNEGKVINLVFQLGFHSLLTKEGMDADRNAIIEEARGYQFDPYRPEEENYDLQIGGSRYAELVSGNIADVRQITRRHLLDFYSQNYQAANSYLIVASPEPIREIGKIVGRFTDRIDPAKTVSKPKPRPFNLPWLEYPEPVTTFHNIKDEADTQSDISIAYMLETAPDFRTYVIRELGGLLISQTLYNLLTEKLNLAYGAEAEVTTVENSSHGQEESYSALEVSTSLIGTAVTRALDTIERVEETVGKDGLFADFVLKSRKLSILKTMESGAQATADAAVESAQIAYDQTYDPQTELEIIERIRAKEVVREARRMMSDRRLTSIAGPSKPQLKKAAAHASKYR